MADLPDLRIGLLLCDHLDDEVATQVGDYTELYPAAFGPAGISLRVFDVTREEFPNRTDGYDGWIVSGSRRSTYEDESWIHRLEELVRELYAAGERIVGICFGHQMIAQALGGRVERADVGWGVGAATFAVGDPAPWMDGATRFTILMSHRDQVTVLPDAAAVIASADYCPVGAYRIGEQVFCVQGHPEFVPELSRILLRSRREVVGDRTVDAALATLGEPLDHERIIGWIAGFFSR